MALLEEGAREALGDVVARVLRRNIADGRDEDLDCTLLTWGPHTTPVRPGLHINATFYLLYKLLIVSLILVNICQTLLCAVIFYKNKLINIL